MWRERQLSQYPVFGVNFGAAPEGGNMEFVRGQTNAQYFARRSSQLGWSLRLRAVRTKRLMEGEDIDLSTCLVITPAIEGLERFLAQLSQPEFDETSTGKVEIPTSTTCAGIRLTGAMLPWLRTWPWWWALCNAQGFGEHVQECQRGPERPGSCCTGLAPICRTWPVWPRPSSLRGMFTRAPMRPFPLIWDWDRKPPASLVELVSVASQEVYAACGFNTALWGGSQAASVREAWRLALFGVLSPLGRLVEAELQDKLEDSVTLSWQELRASDLSGRARAFQSMVGGGMEVERAAGLAGLTGVA